MQTNIDGRSGELQLNSIYLYLIFFRSAKYKRREEETVSKNNKENVNYELYRTLYDDDDDE